MHKTILLALLLVVWNCAGAQSPQENQELMNAALRLKQAAVLRTLEDCKAKGGSVKSCNSLLELTHQREVKIIERLKLAPTDPAVNMDEASKEMAACYSPNYGYVETVECWSQLSDRLDAARKARSLLRSAGPATTVAPAPPVAPPEPPASKGGLLTSAEVDALILRTQECLSNAPGPDCNQMRAEQSLREHGHNYQGAVTHAHADCLRALPAQPSMDNPAWIGWNERRDACEVQAQQEHDRTVIIYTYVGEALGALAIAALLCWTIKRWHRPMMKILRVCSPLSALSCVLLYRWLEDRRIWTYALPRQLWNGENVVDWTAWPAIAVVILLGTIAVVPWTSRVWNAWLRLSIAPPEKRSHGVTPLSVISERPPQERISPSRGLRLVGMGLMTLWMTYGLLHVLFASWLFPERAGPEVVGGFLQFGVALSAFLWLRRRHTSAQKTLL